MRISDWSSDVCSSDLADFEDAEIGVRRHAGEAERQTPLIVEVAARRDRHPLRRQDAGERVLGAGLADAACDADGAGRAAAAGGMGEVFARSEEHTSELQSLMRLSYAVFCLKKKKN